MTVYTPDGRMKFTYAGITHAAYDHDGHLFTIADSGLRLLKFDENYTLVQSVPLTFGHAVGVSDSGTVYVLGNGMMRVYSPDLVLRSAFEFPNQFPETVDVLADDCTVLSFSYSWPVYRFDVCSKRVIPTPREVFEVAAALNDGGYIAIAGRDYKFFDPNGKYVRLLQRVASFVLALAFDPDPHFLWLLTAQGLQKIEISTGDLVQTLPLSGGDSFAIAGETRPSSTDILVKGRREAVRHPRH